MNDLVIGVCGLSISSGNKGCSALAISFLDILYQISNGNIEIVFFGKDKPNVEKFPILSKFKNIIYIEYHFKNILKLPLIYNSFKKCNYVFDFTEGDSFTDLYGLNRFLSTSFLKYAAIKNKSNLILGPQTIGPFHNKIVENIAKRILEKSYYIYSRDNLTEIYVENLIGKKCNTVIDVAFGLPYSVTRHKTDGKIRLGINISGLLWKNEKNNINLTVDYREYINKLIERYYNDKNYEIHLIAHVIALGNEDDDVYVINEIKSRYPKCIVMPYYNSPIDIKTYISGLDILTGARMHATIAAYSTKVAVIPFSYSRKFEGLFSTLNYPYIIKGTVVTTETALEQTFKFIENYKTLKSSIVDKYYIVDGGLEDFKKSLINILKY